MSVFKVTVDARQVQCSRESQACVVWQNSFFLIGTLTIIIFLASPWLSSGTYHHSYRNAMTIVICARNIWSLRCSQHPHRCGSWTANRINPVHPCLNASEAHSPRSMCRYPARLGAKSTPRNCITYVLSRAHKHLEGLLKMRNTLRYVGHQMAKIRYSICE